MTENEAIEELKNSIISYEVQNPSNITCDLTTEVLDVAIQALRDIQQYREVGTVDECREANGKQMPKKVKEDGYFGFVDYVCPTCGHDAGSSGTKYCKNCGQNLMWL